MRYTFVSFGNDVVCRTHRPSWIHADNYLHAKGEISLCVHDSRRSVPIEIKVVAFFFRCETRRMSDRRVMSGGMTAKGKPNELWATRGGAGERKHASLLHRGGVNELEGSLPENKVSGCRRLVRREILLPEVGEFLPGYFLTHS